MALGGDVRSLWRSPGRTVERWRTNAALGAGNDQVALELGQPAQHRRDQPAARRGGVGPYIVQRTEGGIRCTNGSQRVQQIAGRAREPVQPGHDHRITVIQLGQQPRQLLAVRRGKAALVERGNRSLI